MRNAEATRERILVAAMAEFSAYGVAGARVDRIAKSAGCNKNLIYIYFENKERLFTTVLEKHLLRVYEELVFTPDDLPGYAARVFDFTMAQPDLMRLMAWFTLEQRTEVPAARDTIHDAKVTQLMRAQNAGQVGTAFSPSFLLTIVMTLATTWTAGNPFGPALDPDAVASPETLRQNIVEAVKLIANANANADADRPGQDEDPL
ncbi:TetR family transcriptional regulator [Sphaerisporangium corydalis]|uniref:TetR family transcriptional regulator n=1 Tax=Sphaerisporangium corydalis TaxID=1441875 RepID=A0ABV9EK39_9ACTN|nr:TetR family transcriptional regulator [Sphaerisporangium corydalis]